MLKTRSIHNDEIDKDGYYRHGDCGAIILKVDKTTNINNVYCYCRKCRKEIKVKNIVNGKIIKNDFDSPFNRQAM